MSESKSYIHKAISNYEFIAQELHARGKTRLAREFKARASDLILRLLQISTMHS